jgi:hypothetical protein
MVYEFGLNSVLAGAMVYLTPCHFGTHSETMATESSSSSQRPRISIDVYPELRLAAAKHDLTVRQYVLDAIEERLRQDIGRRARDRALGGNRPCARRAVGQRAGCRVRPPIAGSMSCCRDWNRPNHPPGDDPPQARRAGGARHGELRRSPSPVTGSQLKGYLSCRRLRGWANDR